jgi:hypothetical protein
MSPPASVQSPSGFPINVDLLREFELGLTPAAPEQSAVPARVLGYGEISIVFEIQAESLRGLALKRLAVFKSFDEMEKYEATYVEYNRLLGDTVRDCRRTDTPLSRAGPAAPSCISFRRCCRRRGLDTRRCTGSLPAMWKGSSGASSGS